MSQLRKSTRKKRQTQLTFTSIPSSSPAASQYNEQVARRAASVRYGETPIKRRRLADVTPSKPSSSPAPSPSQSPFGRQKVHVVIHTPPKEASQLPTPMASSQVEEKGVCNSDDKILNTGKSKGLVSGVNGGTPIFGGATATHDGDDVVQSSSEEIITPVRSHKRARVAPIMLSSDECSNDEEPLNPVTPSKKPRAKHDIGNHAATLSNEMHDDPYRQTPPQHTPVSLELRSNGDQSAQKGRRLIRGSCRAKIPKAGESLVISSSVDESTSEDEVITPSRKRRSAAYLAATPTKPKISMGDETDELADEVADLDDSDKEIRESRTRGRQDNSERSKRQRKLEEFRQRRAGIRAVTGEENGQDSVGNVSESEPESIDHAIHRAENLDEYENEFVDDEDDTVGVDLGVAGVPLEFTYHANKKPFEHFKTEVEWMVHNKLNPAFDRHDEVYLLAHDKLNKEVEGIGSSQYRSAAWKENFLHALISRPEFYRIDIPTMLEHKCDACQRSNHPPKHKVILTGKPYNRDTLETIEIEDDDDDSEDKSNGRNGTRDEENFFLGRFCCANAEMAHALRHWRYSLNQTVLQWLADDGQLTPAKIVERDSLRQKKRQKEANKVVDEMEATGVMRDLYRQFKENLEAARDSKPKRFSNRR